MYDVQHNIIGMLVAFIVIYSITENLPTLAPARSPASGWLILASQPTGCPGTGHTCWLRVPQCQYSPSLGVWLPESRSFLDQLASITSAWTRFGNLKNYLSRARWPKFFKSWFRLRPIEIACCSCRCCCGAAALAEAAAAVMTGEGLASRQLVSSSSIAARPPAGADSCQPLLPLPQPSSQMYDSQSSLQSLPS